MRKKENRSLVIYVLCLLVGLACVSTLYASSEDDYLQALEMEVGKLDGGVSADEAVRQSDHVGEGFQGGLVLDEFPSELKSKSPGSYTFYGKLSANDQEEIYLSYKEGASVKEVRAAIMARFLKK